MTTEQIHDLAHNWSKEYDGEVGQRIAFDSFRCGFEAGEHSKEKELQPAMDDKTKALIDSRYQEIKYQASQGNIMFFDGKTTYVMPFEKFTQQGIQGMLYDLNRLEEVTLTLAKNDVQVHMITRLDNDLALVQLVRYLCAKLGIGD